jgi:hypothetical protein
MIFSCVEQCKGCNKVWGGAPVIGDNLCEQYARPYAKWHKAGGCEGATHVTRQAATEAPKKRVGQQKQKKGDK